MGNIPNHMYRLPVKIEHLHPTPKYDPDHYRAPAPNNFKFENRALATELRPQPYIIEHRHPMISGFLMRLPATVRAHRALIPHKPLTALLVLAHPLGRYRNLRAHAAAVGLPR
jgi:hypothetical protein